MTTSVKVEYSYLKQQFQIEDTITEDIVDDIYDLIETGDYTLGEPVRRFEQAICDKYGVKHCIGVGNGTDALFLALRVLGVGSGDTVLTVPNTFIATVGAIVATGAIPVFVDVGSDYLMDYERAVHRRVKAAIPVSLTGLPCPSLHAWENTIHDAAQAIGAERDGKSITTFPTLACFSMHPLKNLNVWGDGGFICTNYDGLAQDLRLLRNHGLYNRDTCIMPGYNSRLDSIQAIVAYHGLKQIDWINERRGKNAQRYDEGLRDCSGVVLPPRQMGVRQVFHTYVVQVDHRAELQAYLAAQGIETKIHYPKCIHEQPGYKYLGYKRGDFPVAEAQADHILSLPIHQYLTEHQIEYVVQHICRYFKDNQPF